MKQLLRAVTIAAVIGLSLLAWMWIATQDPVVRRATLEMADWPPGAPPLRVALLSDIHIAGPDMPPSRLARIVEQVNRLRPDVVVLAGDFVSDKEPATRRYPAAEGLAPLARLAPALGTFAVPGNHDHWREITSVVAGLEGAGVRVLRNEAATVGPLRLGGVDDHFTGHDDLPATIADMRAGRGSRVLLTHSPDVAPETPADITLILAGHTHCGQIRLPFVGALSYESNFGDRFSCGIRTEGARRVITTAGLGTSVLPIRFGAPPDLWLLTLAPARPRSR